MNGCPNCGTPCPACARRAKHRNEYNKIWAKKHRESINKTRRKKRQEQKAEDADWKKKHGPGGEE